MTKVEKDLLKSIKLERTYDTMTMSFKITKQTQELIYWEAKRLDLDFDIALELMVGVASLTKTHEILKEV